MGNSQAISLSAAAFQNQNSGRSWSGLELVQAHEMLYVVVGEEAWQEGRFYLRHEPGLNWWMSNCYCNYPIAGMPPEGLVLREVEVRLILSEERERFDLAIKREDYQYDPTALGQVLRYVAVYRAQ